MKLPAAIGLGNGGLNNPPTEGWWIILLTTAYLLNSDRGHLASHHLAVETDLAHGLECHLSILHRIERVILAHLDVCSRDCAGATLTNDDHSSADFLSVVKLYAQILGLGVSIIFG